MPDEFVVIDGLRARRDRLEGEKLAKKVDYLVWVRVDELQNLLFPCVDHRGFSISKVLR